MTEDEFRTLIELGHEMRGIEVKGPGSARDRSFMAKVARAVMGMANARDGGLVIIGVSEADGQLQPVGLDDGALAAWTHDGVSAQIARYADPNVAFDLQRLAYRGRNFVVLRVHEFDDVPIVCKAPVDGVLRQGAVYVRSRRMPETVETQSQGEMRELLDLATEKRLRAFLAMSGCVGLALDRPGSPSLAEQFAAQVVGLAESTLYRQIVSRGHWLATIRPTTLVFDRVQEEQLWPLVQRAYVRGGELWFPTVDQNRLPTYGDGWIGQEIEDGYEASVWRFFTTGQLVQATGMRGDWTTHPADDERPGPVVDVALAVARFTEVFEFAERLALSDAGDAMMRIEVTTAGVRGRSLWYRSGSTRTFAQYRTDSDEVPLRQDFSREELVGNAQRIAVQWAARFFRRFGYQPPIEAIRNIQGRTWFGGELPADH